MPIKPQLLASTNSSTQDAAARGKSRLTRLRGLQSQHTPPVSMSKVACIILAGGQGSRLFPLTQARCKPAIQFGGRYKLIDVPISNALASGIDQVFVLTQFLSRSLHHHIFSTYRPNPITGGFVEVLSAEQRANNTNWYAGTADSVRQNLDYIFETGAEYVLILSGDQLYHIDFQAMLQAMIQQDVDLLVATLAIDAKQATRMGIMKVNEDHSIIDFHEKPTHFNDLERLKTSPKTLKSLGFHRPDTRPYLGSMGIYLFKRHALCDLLSQDTREDFGKHLIPTQVTRGKIGAFAHDGYWEDIGTVESFLEANIALTQKKAPFDLYMPGKPIFSTAHHLPGAKMHSCTITDSIVCEGSLLDSVKIQDSVIGQRSVIKRGTSIHHSYLMGNDAYASATSHHKYEIGEECFLKKCIIDKDVVIGNQVHLVNKQEVRDYDSTHFYVRDGVIVVPRGAVIPSGFVF